MAKTEVYSWRLSPELKRALEDVARERDTSVAELLDTMAREWLEKLEREAQRDQQVLRERALAFVGSIAGGDPHRAEQARERVRARLRGRSGAAADAR